MKLTDIKPQIREIELTFPRTYEPTGIKISLRPGSHPKVLDKKRKLQDNELLNRRGKLSAAKMEALEIDLFVAYIDGWDWSEADPEVGLEEDGVVPEFSEQNARRLLKDVEWAYTQIKTEIDDTDSFYQA